MVENISSAATFGVHRIPIRMEWDMKLYLAREKRCKPMPFPRPSATVSKKNRRVRREIVRAKKLARANNPKSGAEHALEGVMANREKDYIRARASTALWVAKKKARTNDMTEELANLKRENAIIVDAIKKLENLVGEIGKVLDIELYTNKVFEDTRRGGGHRPEVGLDITAFLDY